MVRQKKSVICHFGQLFSKPYYLFLIGSELDMSDMRNFRYISLHHASGALPYTTRILH